VRATLADLGFPFGSKWRSFEVDAKTGSDPLLGEWSEPTGEGTETGNGCVLDACRRLPAICQLGKRAHGSGRRDRFFARSGGVDVRSLEGDVSWCLDQPLAETAGLSKLCRQVPVQEYDPSAHAQNWMCAATLGRSSAWHTCELISTEWFNAPSSGVCETGSGPTDRTLIRPQVPVEGDDQSTRPFLGNTSMESYSRPNCMGCHTNASVDGTSETPGTDMTYWLQLEVSVASAGFVH
jgi:hypothetical protein